MKLVFLKNFALFFAGISLIVFCLFSCKKNLLNPLPSDNLTTETSQYNQKAMEIVRKIKHFDKQLARCKTEKVDCNIQIDSALWNMEALINATHTFPEKCYEETVKHDLQFTVDVDDNGCLAMNDVALLYDDITNSVRDAYANDGITSNKSLMTVVFNEGEIVDGKLLFEVSVVSGRSNDNQQGELIESGPFVKGDCWYYGELGGTCEDPSIVSDAAEEIEDWINYLYAKTLVPLEGYRYINYGLTTETTDGEDFVRENGISYIFNSLYAPADQSLYFSYEDLNYYFNGEKKVILQLMPEKIMNDVGQLPDNFAFIQVDIQGLYQEGASFHRNKITYGNRLLVPVLEIGPATDLLK